jgi:hypothetical protein
MVYNGLSSIRDGKSYPVLQARIFWYYHLALCLSVLKSFVQLLVKHQFSSASIRLHSHTVMYSLPAVVAWLCLVVADTTQVL